MAGKYQAKTFAEEEEKKMQAKLYYLANKERIQQYYQDNKAHFWKKDKTSLAKYNNAYYLKHKATIDKKSKERAQLNSVKVSCECGATISKSSMGGHVSSAKHLRFIEKNPHHLAQQTDVAGVCAADDDSFDEQFNYNWRPHAFT